MKWLILVLLVALVGCVPPWWNVSNEYDPTFAIPSFGFQTPQDVGRWELSNIVWTADPNAYFQSPEETYNLKTGDCEDYSALMMYFIHKELGGWTEMEVNANHAWVSYNGRWYEPQTGDDVTNSTDTYIYGNVKQVIPYGKAMWRSMNTHKSMEAAK